MLEDLTFDVIENNNTIITSSTGNGATSLALFFLNKLLQHDRVVIFYCPTIIDREFVKEHYKNVFKKTYFIFSPIVDFLSFLQEIRYSADLIVIDPGDVLLSDKNLLINLADILKINKTNLLCTSQIRQIPKTGQVYSTLERFNDKRNELGKPIFKYSLWIRDVTSEDFIYKQKYVDTFLIKRQGNNMLTREIAHVSSKTGNVVY